MTTFKIAHVSDFHIGHKPHQKHVFEMVKSAMRRKKGSSYSLSIDNASFLQGTHCPDVAYQAAKFLSQNLIDHKYLLVSGDLAATGLHEDLRRARRFVMSPPSSRGHYLDLLGLPTLRARGKIIIMPGNHDRFTNRTGSSGGQNFELNFDDLWPAPLTRVRVATLTSKSTDTRLRLVIGDFCLRDNSEAFPGMWPFYTGQGTVNPNTLRAMEVATAKFQRSHVNDGIVWVTHFPPTGQIVGMLPGLQLNGWRDIINVAKSLNIKYIISGHLHLPNIYYEDGVQILCGGALCTFQEDAGNWIHSLQFQVASGQVELIRRDNYMYVNDTFMRQ